MKDRDVKVPSNLDAGQKVEIDEQQKFELFELEAVEKQNVFDEVKLKRILRKVDVRIIPTMMVLYFLAYLDRSNIGNARLANYEADLNLNEDHFYWSLQVFYFGYSLCEIPANYMLKKLRPSRWIGLIMLLWGITSTCLAACWNFGSLFSARLLLGIFEAGLFPGIVFYLSFWYSKKEMAFRMALFYSGMSMSGLLGGLIAFGVMRIEGHLRAWQYLYIIEGVPTILVGALTFFLLPDYPETAKFLTEEERNFLVARLRHENNSDTGTEVQHDHRKMILEAFKEPRTYLFAIACIAYSLPGVALNLFLPTIVKALGHSDVKAQAMAAAPYAPAAVCSVLFAFFSDKFTQRAYFLMLVAGLAVVGFLLQLVLVSPDAQYGAMFLVAIGLWSMAPLCMAWVATNFAPAMKRGIATAFIIACGNLVSSFGSQMYRNDDKPRFVRANSINLAICAVLFISCGILRWHLAAENKKRDKMLAEGKYDPNRTADHDRDPVYRFTL
ncbi:uncharacterized protein VTP21DRAFT_1523 [Calcarisporiella thermophila]|uniref:uncharacterized protein n=1 Tax=Calcarisporiella thermophila TaxID=911321 RepID=UPI003743381F